MSVGLKNKIKIAVIPARLNSVRLPKKILAEINGRPMAIHTADQISKCKNIDRIILAIDDHETYEALRGYDYELEMTSKDHQSGTDRIAEVVQRISNVDVVINIQADEPFIDPKIIDSLVDVFDSDGVRMATAVSTKLYANELLDTNVVKAHVDKKLYAKKFSRVVGSNDDAKLELGGLYKHLGVYGFTKKMLLEFVSYNQSENEKLLKLEQLRAIDNSVKIKVILTDQDCISINTIEDLLDARGEG